MGSIDIIKPLSTVLKSAVYKSQPGAPGWEVRMLPLCYAAPRFYKFLQVPKNQVFQS